MPLKYSIYKLRWSRRQVVGVNGGRTASRTLTPESRIQIDNLWPNTQFLFIVFLLFIISWQFHRRLCCYNSKHFSTKVKMSPPLDKKVNIRLNLAWSQSVLNRLCALLFASDQTVFMCPDIANLWVAVETMLCASNNLCWWSSFPSSHPLNNHTVKLRSGEFLSVSVHELCVVVVLYTNVLVAACIVLSRADTSNFNQISNKVQIRFESDFAKIWLKTDLGMIDMWFKSDFFSRSQKKVFFRGDPRSCTQQQWESHHRRVKGMLLDNRGPRGQSYNVITAFRSVRGSNKM